MSIRSVRFTRLLLVLLLALSVCVHSSHAMLSEMVVGAGMFYQAFEVLGVLLPQLAALGTSMVALAAVGRQVASSFKSFFNAFLPKQGGDQVSASPSPGASPAPGGAVPEISGPTEEPSAAASPVAQASPAPSPSPESSPSPAASPSAGGKELSSVTRELVRVYHQRMEGGEGAPGAPSNTSQLEGRYDELRGQVTGLLVEAISDGDTAAYDRFEQDVKALDPKDRQALKPVITQAARQGARFSTVHSDRGGGAFARLRALKSALFSAELAPAH